MTTVISVTIGLIVVNTLKPGDSIPPETKEQLQNSYQQDVESREADAEKAKGRGPLQPIVDMVPDNFFNSASDNRNMLQIVFVAILIGIGLIQVPKEKAQPVLAVFQGLNNVIIRIVDIIMLLAPLGVFSLIANTITSVAKDDISQVLELLGALGYYCLAVILGLIIHMILTYTAVLKIFSNMSLKTFYKGIAPAQLVAFSTSSSGATLPVTMERCEEKLGVSEEVSSFALPLGATINMDGTALYQAVAAVFIAQALNMELTMSAQLTIILTAVLASIGTAAVPGAGIIMLVIILEAIGVPSAGIALILGVDRILDMLRTTTNVTGDCSVAVAVASSEGQLRSANLSEEEDHIKTAS
jgi:Na+/H+-dicarboxylate symporter